MSPAQPSAARGGDGSGGERVWYASQYARVCERAAQLSTQVADLQHRLGQCQGVDDDVAFDAPPDVPAAVIAALDLQDDDGVCMCV